MHYYFLLSLHLISLFVWISSFFYLYRLNTIQINQNKKVFLEEAHFIYKRVASPSLLMVVIFGISLISLNKGLLASGAWIYIKLFLISLMILMHFNYKINLELIEKNKKAEKREVVVYHTYSIFIMLAFVIVLTITKPF